MLNQTDKTKTNFSKLLVHPDFTKTVNDIKKVDMAIPPVPSQAELDLQNYVFPPNAELITPMEDILAYPLNSEKGAELTNFRPITAYDESINKFLSLEGSAYFTSHSLVLLSKEDFVPINFLTLYFYTRSKKIINKSSFIKYSVDIDMDSKKDFIRDKISFLVQNTPEHSILFIDGPLIGGDVYTIMIHAVKKFSEKDIIPIFFVKNSSSNLVTDNISVLKSEFNSDMHWAYRYLANGQRTNFFKYVDRKNAKNAKVFCYFKAFNLSPQRVEFHVDTYTRYKNMIPLLMDLIYYFLLVQGDVKNPQIRPIAIAEKYARHTLNVIDFYNLMHGLGIMPTMNQERFAW